jgi:hypothetical protein
MMLSRQELRLSLSVSNLRNLDHNRTPAPTLEIWMQEEQFPVPYDKVRSIAQKSEYDERLEWDGVYRYKDENKHRLHGEAYEGQEYENEGTLSSEEMEY